MIKIKKILFPTDFSTCAEQAMTHALHLTREYNAELHMMHAIVLHEDDAYSPDHQFPNADEIHNKMQEVAIHRMSRAIDNHDTRHLNIKQVQERGISTAPLIVDYAKTHDIDLITMGTHGRRGLGHLFLGSVAEEVVRSSECPVLTIRESAKTISVEKIKRILVPVDFSSHSRRAISYAKKLAKLYNARLQLLHVVEQAIHPAFYMSGTTSLFQISPDIKTKSEQELELLVQESNNNGMETFDSYVIEGHAATDIVKFAADYQSDLIVIATHGLTGIDRLLLGSVTEKVVRRAPCPVFTLKAYGKSLI